MNIKSKSTGFTLIELMIVIAIIGVIVAVVIGALKQEQERKEKANKIPSALISTEDQNQNTDGAVLNSVDKDGIENKITFSKIGVMPKKVCGKALALEHVFVIKDELIWINTEREIFKVKIMK